MPAMTDPFRALQSFQAAYAQGGLAMEPGRLDPTVFLHLDLPNGRTPRFTFVRVEGTTVTCLVELAPCDPVQGTPCFQVGYAVEPAFRNRGLAKQLLSAALAEMQFGFGGAGVPRFYVEAIVGADNVASQRVAAACITSARRACTDQVSGSPSYQYLAMFETAK